MIIPNIWENKKWQPNHQPVFITLWMWWDWQQKTGLPRSDESPTVTGNWFPESANLFGLVQWINKWNHFNGKIWRFPKRGVPPNHPFWFGSSTTNHPASLGYPQLWKPPYARWNNHEKMEKNLVLDYSILVLLFHSVKNFHYKPSAKASFQIKMGFNLAPCGDRFWGILYLGVVWLWCLDKLHKIETSKSLGEKSSRQIPVIYKKWQFFIMFNHQHTHSHVPNFRWVDRWSSRCLYERVLMGPIIPFPVRVSSWKYLHENIPFISQTHRATPVHLRGKIWAFVKW